MLELYVLPALITVRDYLRAVPMLQEFVDAGSPVLSVPRNKSSSDTDAERAKVTILLQSFLRHKMPEY